VNRNLIFPLDHRFSPSFKFQMPNQIQMSKPNS
jgi:hypothetical protein